jgi:hypothetical protein
LSRSRVWLENAQDKDRVIKAAIGAVLAGARLDAIAGLARHLEMLTEPDSKPAGNLGRSVVLLTREKVGERIRELLAEMTEFEDRDGQEYAFSFVLFPMVGPVKGERP